MPFLKSNWIVVLGGILGLGLGYLYWYFYGCINGCTISSVWWRSSLYGSLMGGLAFSSIKDYMKKKNGKF